MTDKVLTCYNCGNTFEKKETTKEHIPSRNLFDGYDDSFKVNRITVTACFDCNNQYSPTDEEFRNMIGIIAKNKENNEIKNKTIRSLKRKNPKSQLLDFDSLRELSGITFNGIPIENFHKKIFKGLFFHQYGKAITDDYELFVNIDQSDWSPATMGFLGYLKELFDFKKSGHFDILKYSLQPFRLGVIKIDKKDLTVQNEENIFICYMDFNKEHGSLVIAVRKKYLENLKKKA